MFYMELVLGQVSLHFQNIKDFFIHVFQVSSFRLSFNMEENLPNVQRCFEFIYNN